MRDAFVFPGQGSQQVGMCRDFFEAYPVVRDLFQQADDLLGFALSGLCFDGPEDELNDTINTQPALYVCSLAILHALQQSHPAMRPAFAAGHSLGEITALAAAGAISFADGLHLVRERGRLMKAADQRQGGGMAAVLGLPAEDVHSLCQAATAQTGRPVILANDNCPGQIVISGDDEALAAAMAAAESQGARKVVKLPISIAAHSPLMEPASAGFCDALDQATFTAPAIPVYANATAAPLSTVESIRETLGRQLTNPVRWTESVLAMIADGAERFVEIGPGDVLTGLMKRIDRGVERVAVNTVEVLQKL